MPRLLLSVALVLLAFAPAGRGQPPVAPPRAGFPQARPGTNAGACSGCGKEVTWTGSSANAPKKCPHCGVGIDYVENEDGSRTRIPGGGGDSGSSFHSFRGVGKLVGLAVFVVCVVLGGLAKLVGMLFSGGSPRPKRRKAKKRRPVEDDDDEEEAAPPRPRDRPRAGGKPVPMATLADDDGYEVVGDAPPAATPEPPRRAKARLIAPGGTP